jgi:hypothetical protein
MGNGSIRDSFVTEDMRLTYLSGIHGNDRIVMTGFKNCKPICVEGKMAQIMFVRPEERLTGNSHTMLVNFVETPYTTNEETRAPIAAQKKVRVSRVYIEASAAILNAHRRRSRPMSRWYLWTCWGRTAIGTLGWKHCSFPLQHRRQFSCERRVGISKRQTFA